MAAAKNRAAKSLGEKRPAQKNLDDPLQLAHGAWGLPRAKSAAAKILAQAELVKVFHAEIPLVKELIRALLSGDSVLRQRAADTARRVTEKNPILLNPHAEDLLGLCSESANDNWRTRAHLGLVVARTVHTRAQRTRAAGLLMPLYYDPSNVVRCTAIEGLAILARQELTLRPQFEAMAGEALITGTLAMKNRAQHGLARLHI